MNTRPDQSSFGVGGRSGLAATLERIEIATATEAIAWAWDEFGERCCVLSSMQETVVVELAMRVSTDLPVAFLDTGYHFDETWETVRRVERRYGIAVEVVGPLEEPRPWVEPGVCCDGKRALLDRALEGRDAWITGIRRHQTDARSTARIVDRDGSDRVKVSPLAQWSDDDHRRFVERADVIRHPLLDRGYPSIGCRTCTERPAGADPRSGRWADTDRTECGLHL